MLEQLARALGTELGAFFEEPGRPALYLRGFLRLVRNKSSAARFGLEHPPNFTKPPEHIDAREWLGQWAQFMAQLNTDAQAIAADWWRILAQVGDQTMSEEEKALLSELRREIQALEDAAPKALEKFVEARDRFRREAHLEAELSAQLPRSVPYEEGSLAGAAAMGPRRR